MTYKGSGHCGRIAFEVDGEPTKVPACNGSICSPKGSLLWFVQRDTLRLLTPDENASTYLFNKRAIGSVSAPPAASAPMAKGPTLRASAWRLSMSAVSKTLTWLRLPSNISTAALIEQKPCSRQAGPPACPQPFTQQP